MEFYDLSHAGRLKNPNRETIIKNGRKDKHGIRSPFAWWETGKATTQFVLSNKTAAKVKLEDPRPLGDLKGHDARLSRNLKGHNPKHRPRPDLQRSNSFDKRAFKLQGSPPGNTCRPPHTPNPSYSLRSADALTSTTALKRLLP